MNNKVLLSSVLLVIMLVPVAPNAVAQANSKAELTAQYRDVQAAVYDRIRGIYGKDYSYDYNTNKYTTYASPSNINDLRNTIVVDGKLNEDIWKQIEPVTVNLQPTEPYGGAIKSASIRAITNGTWVFMALQWADSTASRNESPRIKRPDGSFFYNQTHYYSDNFYIGWWMNDGQPTVKPWFNAHYAGTTMGRVPWKNEDLTAKANVWTFKAYFSDDEQQYWPLTATTPRTWRWGKFSGQDLIFPYPHMVQTMLNATANYYIGGGVTHVSGCAFPEKDQFPFDVRANGFWENGLWTLEVARPFKPHPLNEPLNAVMSFQQDKVYSIFFGAGDGQHGENENVGSISRWFTLYMEPAPPSTAPPLFAVAIGGMAVVGVVGAIALRRRGRNVTRLNAAAKTQQ